MTRAPLLALQFGTRAGHVHGEPEPAPRRAQPTGLRRRWEEQSLEFWSEPELADWSAARYLGDHSLLVADVFPAEGATPGRMELRALAEDLPHNVVDSFTLTARTGSG